MNRNPITLTLGLVAATVVGVGQIPLSTLTSGFYTQNFNTLSASGTGITWTDNSTLPGWYANRTTYRAGIGVDSAVSIYSFGNSVDRALGSVGGGGSAATTFFGLMFYNDTARAFAGFNFDYDGEQWRKANVPVGGGAPQSLSFSYKISSSPIGIGDAGFGSVTALDFVSPIFGAGGSSALNGNDDPNNSDLAVGLTFSSSLDPGEYIMFRWSDPDDLLVADHGLAIDNLSIEVPEVSAFLPAFLVTGAGALWAMRRRSN